MLAAVLAASGAARAQVPPPPASPPPAQQTPAPATTGPTPLADALAGQAKEDYAAGRLLYADGDYGAALLKFLGAFAASGDPRLLWNAAVCEKSLRHYANAASLVRRYLAAGSPLVTDEAARDARAFLEVVEPLTGHLTIAATEPLARVYLDGTEIGTTPLGAALTVDIGTRHVTLRKEGFAEYSTTVQVMGKDQIRVDAVLVRVTHDGRLVVRAGRGDAISIDGTAVGAGEWSGTLASGSHVLRVSAPEKTSYQSDLLMVDDQLRTVDVSLEPLPHAGRVPAWIWVVGGAVLVAGAATGAYFVFKPGDHQPPVTIGTISPGTVQLP
jgi:hypothetical protein